MKTISWIVLLMVSFASSALGQAARPDQDKLKEDLTRLERQSWEAWKNHDGKFFQTFLSDDHLEVGFQGLSDKSQVVSFVASPICRIKSYELDGFELRKFSPETALLTYRAAQETTCNGRPVPSPVWVSSLYVKRGGHWLNALFQQSQAGR
ncbi:MAG: nuclear transport factor 2 family protein [Thermoanaerobaculia bacterium]